MSHNVGADELRVRARLRQLVDGASAEPPAMPPSPPPDGYQPRERDWLDDIADLDFGPEPGTAPVKAPRAVADPVPPDDDEDDPEPACQDEPAAPSRRPVFRNRREARDDPRQALADAWGNTPPRLRWLAYHATAAGAGWSFGWADWATGTAAWYAAGHWVSPSAFVLYGLGGCVLALYRRSRWWAWPFAWAAAIPVSSVVVGVLLYGTGYQP